MRERKECHCMLFLTEDNAFAGIQYVESAGTWYYINPAHLKSIGEKEDISVEEIKDLT